LLRYGGYDHDRPYQAFFSSLLAPLDGSGAGRLLSGLDADDSPIGWSADAHALWLRSHRGPLLPVRIDRYDLTRGKRQRWKEIMPGDPAGINGVNNVLITPDGRFYVMAYLRMLSDLYLVEGLR
jgi:hypothetical protein